MALVSQTFQFVSTRMFYAVRVFVFCHISVDLGFGLLLAALAYVIAADGSILRGVLAVLAAFAAAFALGMALAPQVTAVRVASKAIGEAALGKRVLNALFDQLLGVQGDEVRENSIGQAVSGLSRDEFKTRLNLAADQMFTNIVPRGFFDRVTQWLRGKIQRLVVWATVRSILARCAEAFDADGRFDPVAFRDRLADRIDGYVIEQLKRQLSRIMWIGGFAAIVAVIIAASAIRQLPL